MTLTYEEYANALCAKMGWAAPMQNIDAIVAWAAAENSEAVFNPLDTERVESPDTNYNAAGVKDYTSLEEGLQAVADTLNNGLYPAVLQSFKFQNTAEVTAQQIDQSPWGTKDVVGVLSNVVGDRASYYSRLVNEGPAAVPTPTVDPTPVAVPVEPTPAAPVVQGFVFPDVAVTTDPAPVEKVKAIQSLLVLSGLHIAIDGIFGPITEGAVKSFQGSHSLTVDGVVGPETYPALLAL